MFVTNWISTTKIQKISEITNFFRHYFLSRTEVNSTNNFAKNHFFSLSLFRSDNAIFHNKDSISIFYKMQKICKICGY